MRLVAMQTERVLGRRGSLHSAGDLVEWRDGRDRLYVGIVRGEQRTRVRVIADQTSELSAGSAVIGGLGLIMVPTVAGSGTIAVPGLVLLAVAVYGVIRLFWKQRRDQARKDLKELLEILVEAV
jgi:O-antigen/teichoic acid export membrane protein